MEPGQPLRREFEYTRHGTFCWMGAFDVRRGNLSGFTSHTHDSDTFIELLDFIDIVYPPAVGTSSWTTCPRTIRRTSTSGSMNHPWWTRHFTPKHTSWLRTRSGGELMFGVSHAKRTA